MAEVYGVPNIDPDDYKAPSNDGGSVVSSVLFGKVSEIAELLKVSNEKTNAILEAIAPVASKPSTPTSSVNDAELAANTAAIIALTGLIRTATVRYEIGGDAGNFFTRFLIASSSDKRIRAVDKFGEVFGKTVERIGSLGKYSKSIDALSESLYRFFGTTKQIGKGMALAAAGLALFGLAIITFMQAITINDLIMFVGIMTAIRLGSEILRGAKWNFAMAAAGLALLGLAIWAFVELIDFKMATDFAMSLTLIGSAMWAFSKMAVMTAKQSGNIIAASVAIAALAGSMWLFNRSISSMTDFDLFVAGKTLVVAGLAGTLFKFIGDHAISVLKGAGAAAATAAALWTLGKGVAQFAAVDIDPNKTTKTAIAAGIAIGVLGLLGASGPVALAIAIGAGAAAVVGGALWALAKGMQAVSTVNVTEEQGRNFGMSMSHIAKGLMTIGIYAAPLALASPVAIMMAGATIAMAKAINVVSAMKSVDKQKLEDFSFGVSKLMSVYDGSLGSVFKNLFKGFNSAIYTGIATVTILLAGAVRAASWMMPSKTNTAEFLDSLEYFVAGTSRVFDSKKHDFSAIRDGIKSFVGIGSLAKDIADVVHEIGNLEFTEKAYRNGKLVVVSRRKLSPSDFGAVGQSIGQLLEALTSPLANIGSQQDSFTIAGFKITNPFSNKVKKGIEAMAGIGVVFNPLANLVRTFVDRRINRQYVMQFNANLAMLLGGVAKSFITNEQQLKRANKMNLVPIVSAVRQMTESISIDKFATNVPKFKAFTDDVLRVKTALNEMNVDKLARFNVMLQHMNDLAKNGAMKELVDSFNRFIETFVDFTDAVKDAKAQQTAMPAVPTIGPTGIAQPTQLPQHFTPNSPQAAMPTPQQPQVDVEGIIEAVEKLSAMFRRGDAKVQATVSSGPMI